MGGKEYPCLGFDTVEQPFGGTRTGDLWSEPSPLANCPNASPLNGGFVTYRGVSIRGGGDGNGIGRGSRTNVGLPGLGVGMHKCGNTCGIIGVTGCIGTDVMSGTGAGTVTGSILGDATVVLCCGVDTRGAAGGFGIGVVVLRSKAVARSEKAF